MAGNVAVNNLQLGDSSTAANNFVLKTNADGSCTLARGNVGDTTQDIFTIDSSGNFKQASTVASMVRVNTANGYGSTNTKIRRFANVVTNQGSDITYADSATLGASFTINANGVYAINYVDSFSAAYYMGVSLNSTELTTSIQSIIIADKLLMETTSGASHVANCAGTFYLAAGSVIRAHNEGITAGAIAALFTITRVS